VTYKVEATLADNTVIQLGDSVYDSTLDILMSQEVKGDTPLWLTNAPQIKFTKK